MQDFSKGLAGDDLVAMAEKLLASPYIHLMSSFLVLNSCCREELDQCFTSPSTLYAKSGEIFSSLIMTSRASTKLSPSLLCR